MHVYTQSKHAIAKRVPKHSRHTHTYRLPVLITFLLLLLVLEQNTSAQHMMTQRVKESRHLQ